MTTTSPRPRKIKQPKCDACRHNLVGMCPHWGPRAKRLKDKMLAEKNGNHAEIEAKVMVDIGAGTRVREGFLRLDVVPYFKPELLGAICTLPFADDSIDEVLCHHVLEHLERRDLIPAMNEMWRVLKIGGQADIEVPVFPFWQAIADPTHVSFFVSQTFDYFCVNPNPEFKRDPGRMQFETKERIEHMKLYGIKPWEEVRKVKTEVGEILRVQIAKVAE